jgi:hypothetical protein
MLGGIKIRGRTAAAAWMKIVCLAEGFAQRAFAGYMRSRAAAWTWILVGIVVLQAKFNIFFGHAAASETPAISGAALNPKNVFSGGRLYRGVDIASRASSHQSPFPYLEV